MVNNYLIDTNILIKYLNNLLPKDIYSLLDETLIEISVITRMEILVWDGFTNEQTKIIESFLSNCFIHNLEEPIILRAIQIRKKYKLKLPDAIIIATAIENDLTIMTLDKSFNNIKNLKVF